MPEIINVIILFISLVLLVAYLLLKNPYTSSKTNGDYLYLYRHESDYMDRLSMSSEQDGTIKAEKEFIGAWGKTKEDAQKCIEDKYKQNCPNLPRPIVTRRIVDINPLYYLPIFILVFIISALILEMTGTSIFSIMLYEVLYILAVAFLFIIKIL